MFEEVKDHLNEVISIADTCPEKYQEKCFEILLSSLVTPAGPPVVTAAGAPTVAKTNFFSRYNISEGDWTRVFDFDGSSYSVIVKDLKAKGKAPRQVRLALLLGVKGLLETSQAFISKELLIQTCEQYAAYDSKNFAANMKVQKNLLLPKGDGWVLTIPGQEQAAEVIKELAQ